MFKSCFPGRKKQQETNLVLAEPVDIQKEASKSGSQRRLTARPRRRVAIASENSEQLASARWHSAFDALRKEEKKTPEQLERIKAVLKAHSAFGQMDDVLIDQIAHAMRTTYAADGEFVITQGDAGDAFYVVGEGTLEAYVGEGSTVAVKSYAAGDSFGELALMYDCPRAASVKSTAAGGARLYKLGRIAFRNLVSAALQKAKAGLEAQLSNVALLQGLGESQLAQLAEAMETVTFTAGEYITEMGQPADSLYLILAGEVACHKAGETELRLAEGAVFGESALSHASSPKREANVVAVGTVRCAMLVAAEVSYRVPTRTAAPCRVPRASPPRGGGGVRRRWCRALSWAPLQL